MNIIIAGFRFRDIDENTPHIIQEVICLKCLYRYMAVFPERALLKTFECPKCHQTGYIIGTGQYLEDDNADFD